MLLVDFCFCGLCRLNTFAVGNAQRSVIDACTAVDLNDNTGNELLDAFHLTRLVGLLVELATTTAAPFAQFPERWTRLAIALHELFIHNRFFHVSALFWRISARRLPSDAPDNGLL